MFPEPRQFSGRATGVFPLAGLPPNLAGKGFDSPFCFPHDGIVHAGEEFGDGDFEYGREGERGAKRWQSTVPFVARELFGAFPAKKRSYFTLEEPGPLAMCLEIICQQVCGHEWKEVQKRTIAPLRLDDIP
jgi:hypothetical protein